MVNMAPRYRARHQRIVTKLWEWVFIGKRYHVVWLTAIPRQALPGLKPGEDWLLMIQPFSREGERSSIGA